MLIEASINEAAARLLPNFLAIYIYIYTSIEGGGALALPAERRGYARNAGAVQRKGAPAIGRPSRARINFIIPPGLLSPDRQFIAGRSVSSNLRLLGSEISFGSICMCVCVSVCARVLRYRLDAREWRSGARLLISISRRAVGMPD